METQRSNVMSRAGMWVGSVTAALCFPLFSSLGSRDFWICILPRFCLHFPREGCGYLPVECSCSLSHPLFRLPSRMDGLCIWAAEHLSSQALGRAPRPRVSCTSCPTAAQSAQWLSCSEQNQSQARQHFSKEPSHFLGHKAILQHCDELDITSIQSQSQEQTKDARLFPFAYPSCCPCPPIPSLVLPLPPAALAQEMVSTHKKIALIYTAEGQVPQTAIHLHLGRVPLLAQGKEQKLEAAALISGQHFHSVQCLKPLLTLPIGHEIYIFLNHLLKPSGNSGNHPLYACP